MAATVNEDKTGLYFSGGSDSSESLQGKIMDIHIVISEFEYEFTYIRTYVRSLCSFIN